MQITQETLSPTLVKLTVSANEAEMEPIKRLITEKLGNNVKLPGFREGKAPANLVEKSIDQSLLQNEFLNEAVNALYSQAISDKKIRAVKEPEVSITKFVPFSQLEFTANIESIGEIKLADYKKVKLTPTKATITVKEVDNVIENLRERAAEKTEVKRAAKNGDELNIDFKGVDAKTKVSIEGADGQDYPLVLGSNTFIPGFEAEMIGLKTGSSKSFDITFPKDYNAEALQSKKVNFTVDVKTVKELVKPKLDDVFASTAGPFQNVAALRVDIKKQLQAEKQKEADQDYSNKLLQEIADKTTVAIPDSIVEEEVGRLEDEEKRNIAYRGQTWQEHLDEEGVNAEEHKARQHPIAMNRIKTGLILGEISEKEDIVVTPDELETRLTLLKNQYTDDAMQSELDKPDNQRDIYSRLIIEKTIDRLRSIASKPAPTKKS
jgi:trigger factor